MLATNIKAEEQRAGSERDRLTAAARGLETEIAQLQGQTKLQAERLEVAEDDVSTGDQLKREGFMTAVEFRRRQVAVLEQKQVLSALKRAARCEAESAHRGAVFAAAAPDTGGPEGPALRNELSADEQRIAEIKGRGLRDPRAGPRPGSTLQATSGQTLIRNASSSRSFPRISSCKRSSSFRREPWGLSRPDSP